MPLKGFTSLCSKYAMQIVSKDKGNPQYHRAKNPAGDYVTHYKIDGNVIKAGSRCDYLLLNEESRMADLIELKGSDLVKAAEDILCNFSARIKRFTVFVVCGIILDKCDKMWQ